MFYFAYGSNMLTARLAQRVPSVRPMGPAWLAGHQLHFHLRGGDDSGKCNVLHTGDRSDVVHGVLYELHADGLEVLHAVEGPAYAFVELEVASADGNCTAGIYRGLPDYLDERLIPFDWYCAFVINGAREHALPSAYVAELASVRGQADPDPERARHNARILRQRPRNIESVRSG